MALTQCPECSGQVSTTLSACPHCGFFLSQSQTQEPPVINQVQEPPVTGREESFQQDRINEIYGAVRPPAAGLKIVVLVVALLIIGGAVVFFITPPDLVEKPREVAPNFQSAPTVGTVNDSRGETDDEDLFTERPEGFRSRKLGAQGVGVARQRKDAKNPEVELLPPGDEAGEAERPRLYPGVIRPYFPGLDKREEGNVQRGGEFSKVFPAGMELFDRGAYEELIKLFRVLAPEGFSLLLTPQDHDRKEKLDLWMSWSDFLSAVEEDLSSGAGANVDQVSKVQHIRLTLTNGSEFEGVLVSEDSEKVMVKRGSITASFNLADIKEREAITKPASRDFNPETVAGRPRTLAEIAGGIKLLTLEEVLYFYRMGLKVKSRAWVISVLKKVPEDNPEFVDSVFENIAKQRDNHLIGRLKFHNPSSYRKLAKYCKVEGLMTEFRLHRARYLELRGRITRENSPQGYCKECQGECETVCKICEGDGIEEVPSVVEPCSVCEKQGFVKCYTCYGRGHGVCSICYGRGYRRVRKTFIRESPFSLVGRRRETRSSTVPCRKTRRCGECYGRGQIKCSSCRRSSTKKFKRECMVCSDEGFALAYCTKCGGDGLEFDSEAAPRPIFYKGSPDDIPQEKDSRANSE